MKCFLDAPHPEKCYPKHCYACKEQVEKQGKRGEGMSIAEAINILRQANPDGLAFDVLFDIDR